MNCQMFSTGLSSGDFGGSGIKVILLGTVELGGKVPAGLIEQQNSMGSRRHRSGDLGQMQSHGGGIAARQNKAGGDPLSRANGSEDVGRARPLIERCRGACPALRPSPGDLVLSDGESLVIDTVSATFALTGVTG